ncbi:lipopolysaccharide biosynthesis protein, partial [Actinomadura logoneensis]
MAVRREPEERAGQAPRADAADRRMALAAAALLVFGTALFWSPLRHVDLDAMDGFGLVGVLPGATLAGAAAIVVSFMLTLALPRPHRVLLVAQIAVLIATLHGVAQALEPEARFPTAWQTAGFIEYIERTHTVAWDLDARFSTPGFFAFVAFVLKATGQHDISPVLKWAPPFTDLMYLVPYMLILRVLRATWRAKWFAAWLFIAANWVGQDYLSPQAFAYLLYLYFVAILVNWFRHHDETPRRAGRRRSPDGSGGAEGRRRAGGLA